MVFGIANCGGSGGGGNDSPEQPKARITGDADTITLNANGVKSVQWSAVYANIYQDISSNGNCVTGLAQSADDSRVGDRINRLTELLNAAEIQTGTGSDDVSGVVPSVTIEYADGNDKTYYLVAASEISSDYEVLSNADAILDYYNDILDELDDDGHRYCPGKGDDIPSN